MLSPLYPEMEVPYPGLSADLMYSENTELPPVPYIRRRVLREGIPGEDWLHIRYQK